MMSLWNSTTPIFGSAANAGSAASAPPAAIIHIATVLVIARFTETTYPRVIILRCGRGHVRAQTPSIA